MIIENIIQIGNPLLKNKSRRVKNIFSEETKRVVENLVDTMRDRECVGMAAGQIGEKLRIFVSEIRQTPYRDPKSIDLLRVYINPRITWKSKKETIMYEGCASVAHSDFFGPVKRPEKIIIKASDEKGKRFELRADELLARVIQHEYDHLDGIEFTEKITDIRKIMSREEYLKKQK